jgi:hypothetical protein
MRKLGSGLTRTIWALTIASGLVLGINGSAAAHCDTLDGPVIQDAPKGLETKDVTPVLKWVQAKDEKSVKDSFNKALAIRGKKHQATAEMKFFETLVKIHRAGEGASFRGLKPASEMEPIILEADKSLSGGSVDSLAKMETGAVDQGIRQRYQKAAETLKHKDESVQAGREFVAAHVEYTLYVERLNMDAEGHAVHHDEAASVKKEHKHSK